MWSHWSHPKGISVCVCLWLHCLVCMGEMRLILIHIIHPDWHSKGGGQLLRVKMSKLLLYIYFWNKIPCRDSNPQMNHSLTTKLTRYQLSCPAWINVKIIWKNWILKHMICSWKVWKLKQFINLVGGWKSCSIDCFQPKTNYPIIQKDCFHSWKTWMSSEGRRG